MAQWTEDTRGQSVVFSQQQEQARSLDSSFSQGTQFSQFSGDRNEKNPKNARTPTRSNAQPNNDHSLPMTASPSEPSLDADSIISEFVHGILPQYESSSREDSEDNFDFGSGSFSVMPEDCILPLDGSYQLSQHDRIHHDVCQSIEESQIYPGARNLTTSRSSASQPANTMTTPLLEGTATESPFYQRSPTSSPFTPHVPCVHENSFSRNHEGPAPPSVSLRKRRNSFSGMLMVENCKCLQEIGTLLSDLEYHRSRAGTASLDSILSYHKSALAQLSVLVSCRKCRARSETLVLLSVVCDKSTTLCEQMLSQRLHDPLLHPKGGLSVEIGEATEIVGSDAFRTANKTLLGEYEVTSVSEWQLLMKALFSLQLSRLCRLLNQIKCLIGQLPNGAHFESLLTTTEKRIRGMAARLTCKDS